MKNVRFYIPKGAQWGSLAVASKYSTGPAAQFRNLLLDVAGGFTHWDAQGVWKNEQGRIFDEPVTVYEVFSDKAHGLRNLAKWFRSVTSEESVLFVIDNNPEFI